jgi:hypothetical protein
MSNGYHHSMKQSFLRHLKSIWDIALLMSLLISGCTTLKPTANPASPDPASVFPAAKDIPGWDISQKVATYDQATLFNLVDGQADSFFAYGFEKVAVQRYKNAQGTLLNVEIWQLATSADAYGLFSTGRTGTPVGIGNEGDSDPGRRLAFWQNHYFVSLEALQPVPDATLQAFAQAMTGRLPTGGVCPGLVDRLPQSGLNQQTIIFFHEEISIQMDVWLGGANILGLSQATDGVLGRYQIGLATVRLMLVEYPDSGQAAKGLKALQNGNVADLVASDARGNLLRAVFGKVDTAQAQTLLQEAMK